MHRADCANAVSLPSGARERVIEVEWDTEHSGMFVAAIEVKALDRARLLSDVARALSDSHVNILSSTTATGADRISKMRFEFELGDPSHLESMLSAHQAHRLRLRRLPHRAGAGQRQLGTARRSEPVALTRTSRAQPAERRFSAATTAERDQFGASSRACAQARRRQLS